MNISTHKISGIQKVFLYLGIFTTLFFGLVGSALADTIAPLITQLRLNTATSGNVTFNPQSGTEEELAIVLETDEQAKFSRIYLCSVYDSSCGDTSAVKWLTSLSFATSTTKVWDGIANNSLIVPGDYYLKIKVQDSDTNERVYAYTDRVITVAGDDASGTASINGFVWADVNSNDIQDGGEVGIEAVVVNLLSGGTQVDSVETDADGLYDFTDFTVAHSNTPFVVEFQADEANEPVDMNVGADDTVDSDADPNTQQTSILFINAGDDISNIDAGYYEDADASGQDPTIEMIVNGSTLATTTVYSSTTGQELASIVLGAPDSSEDMVVTSIVVGFATVGTGALSDITQCELFNGATSASSAQAASATVTYSVSLGVAADDELTLILKCDFAGGFATGDSITISANGAAGEGADTGDDAIVDVSGNVTTVLITTPTYTLVEDGTDASDWSVYDSTPDTPVIPSVTSNGSEIVTQGNSSMNGYKKIFNDPITDQFIVKWDWNINTRYGKRIYWKIKTNTGIKYLQYRSQNTPCKQHGSSIMCGVGVISNGQWHTITRDLRKDLRAIEPTNNIISVLGIHVRGNNKIDNILLTQQQTETIHEDGTDASNWTIYDSTPSLPVIPSVTSNGSYISSQSNGIQNGYKFIFESLNASQFLATWDWRLTVTESQRVYFRLNTSIGNRYIIYRADNTSCTSYNHDIICGVGSAAGDGSWHNIMRDIVDDFKSVYPTETVDSVVGIYLRGTMDIDAITLSQ